MPNWLFIVSGAIVASLISIAIGIYFGGMWDDLVEMVGVYFFKAKAKAEEKKLEAQGLKEGEDFLKGDLKGNKQAGDVMEGLGNVGGLKGKF